MCSSDLEIKRFVGGSLESNCYIINKQDRGECYIIDPGYEPKRIIKYVENNCLVVKGIILTHYHHDHVGGAPKISDHFDCPVMMSFEDSLRYKGKTDVCLKHGDSIVMDGEILDIVRTPGHTKGSICIISDANKVVFTGDTIFDTDLGRTDFEDGSDKEMIWSCKNIIDKWPNEYRIYPGHDESATMKQVRTYNKEFLQCLETD